MRKIIFLVFAVAGLIVGCEPVPHYNRVAVASLTSAPSEVPIDKQGKIKPYGSVKFFENKEAITNQYDVIAIMSVEGHAGEEARFITAFLYRAADLGADAIILNGENITVGTEGGGWVIGPHGGFGMPGNPTQEGSYRAEAIRFKQ